MNIRKNQARLSRAEKRRFVNALLTLKRNGTYEEFVTLHSTFFLSDQDAGSRVGHRSPSFLPWHRRMLIEFEKALQTVDRRVTLPYWDWTQDRSPASSLWAPDFLGGTGRDLDGQVMDGPFAYGSGNWELKVKIDENPFLRRQLGLSPRAPELPTKAEVESVLAIDEYDTEPWNSTCATGFRNHLEGWRGPNVHNRVHLWVGGQMATGVSPNDPAFWLHHAFVDKLWAQWQRRHPRSRYLPAESTDQVRGFRATLPPWNDVTPADLIDHRRHYFFDTDFFPFRGREDGAANADGRGGDGRGGDEDAA
ncbi:tyrosinase family protein [Streptomyces bambusae]|uniref:tyrosinase MelC2 n=1 Tax=Streptomyces bambusae TaxID=1550616 RepID=UPI001CFEFBC0|nr:tyrosinase family protein [Streptomyces bambusae]MCB5166513.1 tyrosinase family protein [Streptomyces bambusae]